jgi:lipid A disaccharide synthetase
LQQDFTSKNVAASLRPLLDGGSARSKMITELSGVQSVLKRQKEHGTTADRAAEAILKVMKATQRK